MVKRTGAGGGRREDCLPLPHRFPTTSRSPCVCAFPNPSFHVAGRDKFMLTPCPCLFCLPKTVLEPVPVGVCVLYTCAFLPVPAFSCLLCTLYNVGVLRGQGWEEHVLFGDSHWDATLTWAGCACLFP